MRGPIEVLVTSDLLYETACVEQIVSIPFGLIPSNQLATFTFVVTNRSHLPNLVFFSAYFDVGVRRMDGYDMILSIGSIWVGTDDF
jgi:hypothetical protein